MSVIDGVVEGLDQKIRLRGDIMINGLTNQEIINRIPPQTLLIGISCMFTVDWLSARKLIEDIGDKFPNAMLVAGGEHVTALPELCFAECPSLRVCVMGEGEETIVDICHSLSDGVALDNVKGIIYRSQSGELRKTLKRERIRNLDTIPNPEWKYFPVSTYFREKLSFGVGDKKTLPILATRGCPYICSFCSSPDMWGTKYSMRSVDHVVNEIEELVSKYGVENIDLYDLTAIINSRWIVEFSQEILKRGLNITWQLPSGTRSEAITREVVKNMKMAGCKVVSYAPESGSERILDLIHKKVNLAKMLKSISDSNKEGLYVKVNIIIGLPQETHSDIWRTMLFILKASWYGAYDMGPNPFHPIPGTELYTQLIKEGKIDMLDDRYYEALIDADNLWKVTFYNSNISQNWLRAYFFAYFIIFYGSNFLFRPLRFLITLRNVLTLNSQTRGQYVLQRIIEQNRFLKGIRATS